MVVLILESVPRGLRGELTRWLLELGTGIFAGQVSARVRQAIWEIACSKLKGGSAILIYSSDTEQGFQVEFWGRPGRVPQQHEGLIFVREDIPPAKQKWLDKVLRFSDD